MAENYMKLSKRLEMIASFVYKGSKIADIGTDHGYIPIYLVKEGIISTALAMDVRKGPLERAEQHIRQFGLDGQIEVRLSDGLKKLSPGEADTVIIAGMGGELIIHILEEGKHVWDTTKHLILSPQSDLFRVRKYLEQNGFSIKREAMLKEDGKYYTVMEAEKGSMNCQKEIYYRYGQDLIERAEPVLAELLEKDKHTLLRIRETLKEEETLGSKKRLEELERELLWIEEAQHEMQRDN